MLRNANCVMTNPFQYGSTVGAEAFCNRKKELADLTRAMQNSAKLFVYSERRFGKSSLVLLALQQLPKTFITAYVDLLPTDNPASFVAVTAKALSEAMSNKAEKLLKTARDFFGRLRPSITADEEGKPSVTFDISAAAEADQEVVDVLAVPGRIASHGKRKVVVVFDEFQQLLEYNTDIVERQLRSVIQHQRNVAYIFLGSRKHLMQRMFLDKSRPLYRAGGHYPLPPIPLEDWAPFIRARFQAAAKHITDEQIRQVYELTEGHPFYTQHLSHVLWELCPADGMLPDPLLSSAVHTLLDRESYGYTTLWEGLATNQRRFLKGLAREPRGVRPFASEFTRRYGLGSASNAQRAVQALLERDVVDRDDGSFVITDRFFRLWIRQISSSMLGPA